MPRKLTNKLLDRPLTVIAVCGGARGFLREKLGPKWHTHTIRTAIDCAFAEYYPKNLDILKMWMDWIAYWPHCSYSAMYNGKCNYFNSEIDNRRSSYSNQKSTKTLIIRMRRFLETLPPGHEGQV